MTDINTYAKGVMGENAACEYLLRRGMELLMRRFHSPFGEIDLIMLDDCELVFIEVKTRERGDARQALMAITPAKQKRLIQTARCFLSEHPEHLERVMRFDAIALTPEGIVHLPNAFQGAEWE